MPSTKRKAMAVKIAAPISKISAKTSIKPRINDAKAAVPAVWKGAGSQALNGEGTIEISSDSGDSDEDMDDDDGDDDVVKGSDVEMKTNGVHGEKDSVVASTKKQTKADADEEAEDASDNEPTFGDLVREQETVDVTAILEAQRLGAGGSRAGAGALTSASDSALLKTAGRGAVAAAAPNLESLGNLLNAALRSGDDANLEVCFNMTSDLTWVRNTVQRLDPALAGPLLQKLAARMHRRPGRAHTLIGWVQWTLITHGGALASQPSVTKSLQELHRVLEERARGLNSLLLLKGKLDMLEAQMQMRRGNRLGSEAGAGAGVYRLTADEQTNGTGRGGAEAGKRRRGRGGHAAYDDEMDTGFTTYVDGEDDDEAGQIRVNEAVAVGGLGGSDDEELDIDDEENSEDDDEDSDNNDEILDMAEEDDLQEEEVDFDDVDFDDEDDEDDDDADPAGAVPPPAKIQKKSSSSFSKQR